MQPSWGPRLFWLVVFVLVIAAVFAWFYDPAASPELDKVGQVIFRDRPVTISSALSACEVWVGQRDRSPTEWTGEVKLSKGKLLQVIPVSHQAKDAVQGGRFQLHTSNAGPASEPAKLRVTFLAEANEQITVHLEGESAQVAWADVTETPSELLGGKASIRRATPLQWLHDDTASDDLSPALTSNPSGEDSLVFLHCERGRTLDAAGVLAGNFDSLQQPIAGVSIRLARFQQGQWHDAENVTGKLETALDPVVAVDRSGRTYVAWSQQGTEGWDLYYRMKDPASSSELGVSWSEPKKITDHPGAHQHLAMATDAKGKVWLVWQTWHYDHYDIFAAVINDEQHAWKKPGPVAEHLKTTEGRWDPCLSADRLGNVYVAWSVFRQGHFDLELVKLDAQATPSAPRLVAASVRQETRPALACDAANRVWLAYEESEDTEERDFGSLGNAATKIRVRMISENQVMDLPPVPRPKTLSGTAAPRVSCGHPFLVPSQEGPPLLGYLFDQNVYCSILQVQGWSEPRLLASHHQSTTQHFALAQESGHIVGVVEGRDLEGRARLQVAAWPLDSTAPASLPATAVAAEALEPKTAPEWDKYLENIRLFRQRPQDPDMAKRYLLRGLVFLPGDVDRASSPLDMTRTAFEQVMADWIFLPKTSKALPCERWVGVLRGQALTQKSERSWLDGYARATPESGRVNLILDNHALDAALPAQADLQARIADPAPQRSSVASAEADAKLLEQFLLQQQDLGFQLTSSWEDLANFNPPSTTLRGVEASESQLMPLWRPREVAGPKRRALRLIAYADGKSRDYLLSAIRDRHYYLASDDIYLLARCEKRVPGDVFQTARTPTITVQAQGMGKIAKVEIWRDNQLIKTDEPPGNAAVLEYSNPNIDRQWHSYLVRVIQVDGAMAVTQPFWIRFLP
jgi:hypothetical protein